MGVRAIGRGPSLAEEEVDDADFLDGRDTGNNQVDADKQHKGHRHHAADQEDDVHHHLHSVFYAPEMGFHLSGAFLGSAFRPGSLPGGLAHLDLLLLGGCSRSRVLFKGYVSFHKSSSLYSQE